MSLVGAVRPRPAPLERRLTVFVHRLRLEARIGVYGHERGRPQPLILDVEAELDGRRIDTLADTLNYERVRERALALAEEHIDLVETFAERLALAILDEPQARSVRVRIDKPQALPGADAAGCELVLSRP